MAHAPTYRVSVAGFGAGFACRADERVLIAMERAGLVQIPVGCRGGGCGICKVKVRAGRCRKGTMSRRHVSEQEERAGLVLACRIYPDSDLELEPVRRLDRLRPAAEAMVEQFAGAKKAKKEEQGRRSSPQDKEEERWQ